MKNKFKLLFALSVSAFLSACAFVPEKVQLQPEVGLGPTENIGKGQQVALEVLDMRPDATLGGRPSAYGPAADISLANNIVSVVENTISQGLAQYNFVPVSVGTNTSKQLTIRILDLDYQQRANIMTGTSLVNSTIEATASNNGKVYDNVYHNQQTDDSFFTPTSGADSKEINAALSNTLDQILQDNTLMNFLANS